MSQQLAARCGVQDMGRCDRVSDGAAVFMMQAADSHRDGLSGRLSACGQGDVEQPGGLASIIKEQLIKITHAIKQKGVRVVRLDAKILLHHWRV